MTQSYTVVAGDTLYKIAQKFYGNGDDYTLIEKANPGINPNDLQKGHALNIPDINAPHPTQGVPKPGTPLKPGVVNGGPGPEIPPQLKQNLQQKQQLLQQQLQKQQQKQQLLLKQVGQLEVKVVERINILPAQADGERQSLQQMQQQLRQMQMTLLQLQHLMYLQQQELLQKVQDGDNNVLAAVSMRFSQVEEAINEQGNQMDDLQERANNIQEHQLPPYEAGAEGMGGGGGGGGEDREQEGNLHGNPEAPANTR